MNHKRNVDIREKDQIENINTEKFQLIGLRPTLMKNRKFWRPSHLKQLKKSK